MVCSGLAGEPIFSPFVFSMSPGSIISVYVLWSLRASSMIISVSLIASEAFGEYLEIL